MSTRVIKSIKGRRIRLTQLDNCGTPVDVSDGCGTVVSDGFISVTLSGQYVTGQQFQARDIFGTLCVNDSDPDQLVSVSVSIELCEVHPDVLSIILGEQPVLVSGEAEGFSFGAERNWSSFALEVWTKAVGESCDGRWGYFVVPYNRNGKLDGGVTINNGTLTVTCAASAQPATAAWGTGPYLSNPFPASFPAGDLWGISTTTVQPPAVVDLSLCPDRLLEGGVFWIDAELSATL